MNEHAKLEEKRVIEKLSTVKGGILLEPIKEVERYQGIGTISFHL